MTALLTATNISVRYGNSPAVRDVTLAVAEGELLAIAGANGAGKTTLVNAIAGWSRGPAHVDGIVTFSGQDISRLSAQGRSQIGVALVPEGRSVFGGMTVEENLLMGKGPEDSKGKQYEVEDIFGVFPQLRERAGAKSSTLSGGERQMVAIGRALRAAPTLLILDEPSVGLAPRLVVEILDHIRELVEDGLSVLLVEQNVRAALDVADRLSLLDQGQIVATGAAHEMRDDDRTVKAYLGGLH